MPRMPFVDRPRRAPDRRLAPVQIVQHPEQVKRRPANLRVLDQWRE
jgi:hypothetical protein